MISLNLVGFDKVSLAIALYGKQAVYAAKNALNTQAFDLMREGQVKINSVLDLPTKWTIKSWYVRKKATKESLIAAVGWSDYLANKQMQGPDDLLAQHFFGGKRINKAFERRLITAGAMPSGMQCAIGKAAHEMGMIDGHGNMKPGVLVAILSALSALSQQGSGGNAAGRKRWSANKRAAAKTYWSGKPGPNTPNGIWALDEKYKGGRGRLRPVLIFVRPGTYKKRLDLGTLAAGRQAEFERLFDIELANALKTAR